MTLAKREATLRTLLTHNASESQLLKAALKVRDARIQVLQSSIGEMPTVIRSPQHDRRVAKLRGQIETIRATTPMAILAKFRDHSL
jgi:hypothetical protein